MGLTQGGTYRFEPRGVRADREEADRFEAALDRALRVAFAWNQPLRVRWSSGRRAGASLVVEGPAATNWVEHVLSEAYPRSEWARTGPPEPRSPVRRDGLESWVHRERDLPLSEPDSRGGHRWSETVLAGLDTVRDEVLLEWSVDPLRIPAGPPVPAASPILQPVPTGFRALPITDLERSAVDAFQRRRFDSQWGLWGRLVVGSPVDRPAGDRIASLVETASLEPGRSRLTVHPVRGWWRGGPPVARVSSAEIRSLFPSPWSRRPIRGSSPGSSARSVALSGSSPGSRIPVEPSQGRHLLILGETGMGKSTLLVGLARRAARLGGLVFIDPIGDSARRFAASLDARDRRRATVIAPVASPVGINALAGASHGPGRTAGGSERMRDDLVAALRRVRSARYEESTYWGPRLEETAGLAIEAAASYPGGTLVEALELLERVGRRVGAVPPAARDAVERLRSRVAERPEDVDGTRRLLGEVTRSTHLRRLLCEPRARWSASETVSPGRLVIISGEAPSAGETVSRTLLAVHLALLWAELMARANSGKLFLVLDEVQWYAHEGLGEMLRLGRRFNVHVWAATQSLSRLPTPLRDALLTNSADLVLFRGSPDEAREFSRWTNGVAPEELTTLGRGRAVALLDKGREVAWIDSGSSPDGRGVGDGWAECVESSTDWVVELESPGGTGAGNDGPSVDRPPAALLRELLLTVWAGLVSADPQATIDVPLGPLRRVADPAGRGVRDLGRRLADAGVRLESRREDQGSTWKVRRAGFDVLLDGAVDPEELARAAERWRRVLRDASGGPSPQKTH